jgi:DnaJ-class molecular chaperone
MQAMSTTGMGELVSEIAGLYDGLERLSYYDYLALPATADYIAVREAFYARAQRFHPDRFVALAGESVKRAAYEVYKRMTEAYNVLADPVLRAAYDAGLADGRVRLAAEARSRRLDAQERQVNNVFARVYLRAGRTKLEAGDLHGAWIDAELGLSLDDAPPLRQLRDQIIRRLARPDAGG